MAKTETRSDSSGSEYRRVPEQLQAPQEPEPWVLRRLWDRLNRHNEHTMGCIVGREGSGKSFTAIRIANTIDPNFNDSNVLFDVMDLLELLHDGDHQAGDVYVLDEAGVSLGVRTWQERAQILANQALQLIRDENVGLIFTLPRGKELDSQTKGRLQWYYEIIEKEHDEYVNGKWKWLDPDRSMNGSTVYEKYPVRIVDGWKRKIMRMKFTPPDPEITEPYVERKDEFQSEFYEETLSEARDETDGEDGDTEGPRDIVAEIKEKGVINQFVSVHSGNGTKYIDRDLIQLEFDLSRGDSKKVKKLLERDDDVTL
jgi:hypothetical protein